MIEVLAIDHNGTIACDVDRLHRGFNAVLSHNNLPEIGVDEFTARFKLPAQDMLNGFGVWDHRAALEVWNRAHMDDDAHAHPGVEPTLRRLHASGVRLGVVSAASPDAIESDLNRFGIRELMEFVVGEAHPKSDVLKPYVSRSRGKVVYLGDTEYDMVAGLEAGAIPVGFAGGYRPADALVEAGAVAVFSDWSELSDTLRRLG